MIAVQILGRLAPIQGLLWWSLLPAAIWLVGLLLYLLIWRSTEAATAQRVDQMLDLRERLATALELSRRPPEDEVEELQQADALAMAQRVEPRQIRWAFQRSSLAKLVAPLAIGAALVFLPNPQERVLRQQAEVKAAIAQTSKVIAAQREEAAKNKELSPADRERLQRELQALEKQLAESKTREEALAKLSASEARLRQQLDPQADARRAGMEQLARRLADARQDPNAGRADAAAAAKELQQAQQDLDKLSPEERARLAQALKEQAASNAGGDPALAKDLQSAGDALSRGDTKAAQQSLDQATQRTAAGSQQLANNDANAQALSQVQEGRQNVAQAGQQSQQAAQAGQQGQQGQQGQSGQQGQQGQSGQQGQAGQQGQSGQQGQQGQAGQQGQSGQAGQQSQSGQTGQQGQAGQSGQQGQANQVGNGGGSNADNLGNGTRPGSGDVRPNGQGQTMRDTPPQSSTVYQPYKPSGQTGKSGNVTGQQGQGGQEQVRPGQYAPGGNNPSLVPYEQVYGQYRDAASEALDRSAIPPHLKGYVRDYFGQLAPEK